MRLFLGVTDYEWFKLHGGRRAVDEVNFWRPSPEATFKALQPGEILLFKLHSPNNYIAGGGFFTRFLHLPLNMAWDAFGSGNGALSLDEMRQRVGQYRRTPIGPFDNPNIGCIMLAEPFFWDQADWIPCPADFSLNIVSGKVYNSEVGTGQALWADISARLKRSSAYRLEAGTATVAAIETGGKGQPQIVLPRLGQGLFRVLLTDTYARKCAITGEKTLPVLEAAHIKPYSVVMRHDLQNGLLLRSDLHRLFDGGYLTVDPADRTVVVSKRIREEFENGKEYYRLEGQRIREPEDPRWRPSAENLDYHAYSVFR